MAVSATEDRQFARELLLHTDRICHQRANLLIVSESLMFTSLSIVGTVSEDAWLKAMTSFVGLVVTMLIAYTLVRIRVGLDWLVKRAKLDSHVYDAYTEVGKDDVPSSTILVGTLPLIFAGLWFGFLIGFLAEMGSFARA